MTAKHPCGLPVLSITAQATGAAWCPPGEAARPASNSSTAPREPTGQLRPLLRDPSAARQAPPPRATFPRPGPSDRRNGLPAFCSSGYPGRLTARRRPAGRGKSAAPDPRLPSLPRDDDSDGDSDGGSGGARSPPLRSTLTALGAAILPM